MLSFFEVLQSVVPTEKSVTTSNTGQSQMQRFALYAKTVRFLKVSQLYFRVLRKCYKPRIRAVAGAQVKTSGKIEAMPDKPGTVSGACEYRNSGQTVDTVRFEFLNQAVVFNHSVKWDYTRADRLWLYNLHYFDFLNSRYCLDNPGFAMNLLEDWLVQNPVASIPGWEPYPTSLRIVNWIKWHRQGHNLSQSMLDSLATQVRWLNCQLEYQILANHLFANAKALLLAGLFFKNTEAERWLAAGIRLVDEQLKEQILTDGGHYERSPMYHSIILEDILDIINLSRAAESKIGEELSGQLEAAAAHMLKWVTIMSHPDGEISFFNDAAFGIAATPTKLIQYADSLKIDRPDDCVRSATPAIHLESSGYVRLFSGNITVLVDVAPVGPDYQPGHTHADTLAFELSWKDQRVFVNSGTSTYVPGHLRSIQRATASHNTLEIDNRDSSEVWGGFRVAGRARPQHVCVNLAEQNQQVTASHNGYCKLNKHCIPTRDYKLSGESLAITDSIVGTYSRAVARFHMHPDVTVLEGQRLELANGQQLAWSLHNGHAEVIQTPWYPQFGKEETTNCIVAVKNGDSSTAMTFSIEPCN